MSRRWRWRVITNILYVTKVVVRIHCYVALNTRVPGYNGLPTHTALALPLQLLQSRVAQHHLKSPRFSFAIITSRFHISTHLQQFLIAEPSSIRMPVTLFVFAPHGFHTINVYANTLTRYTLQNQMRLQYIGSLSQYYNYRYCNFFNSHSIGPLVWWESFATWRYEKGIYIYIAEKRESEARGHTNPTIMVITKFGFNNSFLKSLSPKKYVEVISLININMEELWALMQYSKPWFSPRWERFIIH